jgi:hypothetical protein
VVSACALAQKFRPGIKITAQKKNFKLKPNLAMARTTLQQFTKSNEVFVLNNINRE